MKVLVLLVVILTSNIDFSIAKSDPKFRMEKINFIWGKAQNKVDGKMFEKLQVRTLLESNIFRKT